MTVGSAKQYWILLISVPPVTTQQQVHTEEVVTDQQLCNQKKKSTGCQKYSEPQQIKKEEELCSGPGGQLILKLETDAFTQTPGYEDDVCSEDHTMDFDPDESPNVSVCNISFPISVSELQLLPTSSHVAESKEQRGDKHEVLGSTQDGKETNNQLTNIIHTNNSHSTMSESHCNTDTGKSFTCDKCGHDFKCQLLLDKHLKSITDEKRKCCSRCGKVFCNLMSLKTHFRIHTGERPYVCKLCGKTFRQMIHLRDHTKQLHMKRSEKPFSCASCRKAYKSRKSLSEHIRRLHSSVPHICLVCKKGFLVKASFTKHMKSHTVQKPFTCTICERGFTHESTLSLHMTRLHASDGPFICKICGKSFNSAALSKHMMTHVI